MPEAGVADSEIGLPNTNLKHPNPGAASRKRKRPELALCVRVAFVRLVFTPSAQARSSRTARRMTARTM